MRFTSRINLPPYLRKAGLRYTGPMALPFISSFPSQRAAGQTCLGRRRMADGRFGTRDEGFFVYRLSSFLAKETTQREREEGEMRQHTSPHADECEFKGDLWFG